MQEDKNLVLVFAGKPYIRGKLNMIPIITMFRGHMIGYAGVLAKEQMIYLSEAKSQATVITDLLDTRINFKVVVHKRGDRMVYSVFLSNGKVHESEKSTEYLITVTSPSYV